MIGSGSWLANGAIVMASVGPGTVVGAGAVVVRPCQSLGVYVGNPARLVRLRGGGSEQVTSGMRRAIA